MLQVHRCDILKPVFFTSQSVFYLECLPGLPKNMPTEDESTLLLFLIDHKAKGDSGGFKKSTWNAAAIDINKNISKGGMKTGDAYKNKF